MSEFRVEKRLTELRALADRRSWRAAPASSTELRVATFDHHSKVSTQSVQNLVDHIRDKLQITFELRGGGFGCFDLRFIAEKQNSNSLDSLVCDDIETQNLLNKMRAHFIQITQNGIAKTYSAFYSLFIGIATDREKLEPCIDPRKGIVKAFGEDKSDEMHFAFAEVDVQDFSSAQDDGGFIRRVWKLATLESNDFREKGIRVITREIRFLERSAFIEIIAQKPHRECLLTIHGYANVFDQAIEDAAIGAYKTRIDQLELLPIVYSWPSLGAKERYLSDTRSAENSELPLTELIKTVASASDHEHINVLAHSHGGKLLTRAVCNLAKGTNTDCIKRLIYVEPDVDSEFLQDRMIFLSKVANKIIIYNTEGDKALKIAQYIFRGKRAGYHGLPTGTIDANKIQAIDASNVRNGFIGHSPHLDSPEVVRDIHELLMNIEPEKRYSLVRKEGSPGRWAIRRDR